MNPNDIFTKTFNASEIAICITDYEYNPPHPLIAYVNPAFCKLTQYSIEELIGKSPRLLQGEKTSEINKNIIKKCLINNKPYNGCVVNYKKDGTEYYIILNINSFQILNNKYYIAFQIEAPEKDVTEWLNKQLIETSNKMLKEIEEITKKIEAT